MAGAVRQIIITGNWKMHKTVDESIQFIQELIPLVQQAKRAVYLAVPYTLIGPVAEAVNGSNIVVGGQNMNDVTEGAFTGEIAAKMLKDVGAKFVILGHSERRHVFGEDNAFINRKVMRALEEGLQPTLCVGETLKEREAGKTEEVLKAQITESLAGITKLDKMIWAYEPVWAIGTGQTATALQAQEAHQFLRKLCKEGWGDDAAKGLTIQYGGSVKPDNAQELLNQSDIDGLLVGGASLNAQVFSQIVNA